MKKSQRFVLLGLGGLAAYYYFSSQQGGDNSPGLVTQMLAAVQGYKNVNDGPTWCPILNQAESDYGLPADLLCAMAFRESSFKSNVIDGTTPSSAGALGLMQLEPRYYASAQVAVPFTAADTTQQIQDAASTMSANYNALGSWPLAVAAYDAGLTAVKNAGPGIPQNGETPAYVASIIGNAPAANDGTVQFA